MLCSSSIEGLPLFLQDSAGTASLAKCQGLSVRLNEKWSNRIFQGRESGNTYMEITKRNMIHQEKVAESSFSLLLLSFLV